MTQKNPLKLISTKVGRCINKNDIISVTYTFHNKSFNEIDSIVIDLKDGKQLEFHAALEMGPLRIEPHIYMKEGKTT